MKEHIQQELSKLVGNKLISVSRTLNIQMFHFDLVDKQESGEPSRFALHIQCEWRMVGNGLYAGSQDIKFDKTGHYDSDIDWDNETYRDRLLAEMLKRNSFIVKQVSADVYGGFEILFQKNIKLQIIPTSGSKDPSNEFWRIFDTTNKQSEHFVVTSRGIQK
ncbi:MAG: hypothetical protein ABJH05_16320 [Fulvivirga sp.]